MRGEGAKEDGEAEGVEGREGNSCPPGSFDAHLALLCHSTILAFNC